MRSAIGKSINFWWCPDQWAHSREHWIAVVQLNNRPFTCQRQPQVVISHWYVETRLVRIVRIQIDD